MSTKPKKKCPLCFNLINVGGKCSCGYDDKIKDKPTKRTINTIQKICLVILSLGLV